jgi:cob(I)alamin adenosyltransferase
MGSRAFEIIIELTKLEKILGNRLTRVVTKTGDGGTTGLGDGSRVAKTDWRVKAMGEIDELNCHIGVLLCEVLPRNGREQLIQVQHDLFDLGAEIAVPRSQILKESQLERLEQWLFMENEKHLPLKEFALPGGSRSAALAHVCRAACRRSERGLADLDAAAPGSVGEIAKAYINRLSDAFFVFSRTLNAAAGVDEPIWDRRRS